jgi:hypothetical protein
MEIIRFWILMAFLSTAISSGLAAPFVLNHVALAASATSPSSSEPHDTPCGDTSASDSASGSSNPGKESPGCASGMLAICRDAANPNSQTVVVKGSCTH